MGKYITTYTWGFVRLFTISIWSRCEYVRGSCCVYLIVRERVFLRVMFGIDKGVQIKGNGLCFFVVSTCGRVEPLVWYPRKPLVRLHHAGWVYYSFTARLEELESIERSIITWLAVVWFRHFTRYIYITTCLIPVWPWLLCVVASRIPLFSVFIF